MTGYDYHQHLVKIRQTYSSPTFSLADRPGFSITHSSPPFRHLLQGGSSAPTHLIFILLQLFYTSALSTTRLSGSLTHAPEQSQRISASIKDSLTIDTIDDPLLIPLVTFTALDILSIPIRVGFLIHQSA